MNVYFVRHGQTKENAKKVFYGSLDSELTEVGISQCLNAKKHIEHINFDKVYVSESKRTKLSADILVESVHKTYVVDSRINELCFGDFEGKTYEEILKLYPVEAKLWSESWKEFCPPAGESYISFYSRVKSFMKHLETISAENILVVTHGGVIRSAFTYILGEVLDNYWKFNSKNCDISIIKYEYGNWFIDSIVHGA